VSHAISNDLRRRIVDRYLREGESYDSVAEHFQVGRATVNRVVNRFRRTGSVERSPRGGGNPPWISEDELPRLRDLVAEKPDRTADELAREWGLRFGAALSRSSMVRALARAGLSIKKKALLKHEWVSARPASRERGWKAARSEVVSGLRKARNSAAWRAGVPSGCETNGGPPTNHASHEATAENPGNEVRSRTRLRIRGGRTGDRRRAHDSHRPLRWLRVSSSTTVRPARGSTLASLGPWRHAGGAALRHTPR